MPLKTKTLFIGYRLGKGEGYADLEYAMMRDIGAVDENTVIITVVHDCQILDIPDDLMEEHDFDVSYFSFIIFVLEIFLGS